MGIKPNPVHPNLHNDKFGIYEKRPQAINGLGPSLLYINFKWKK